MNNMKCVCCGGRKKFMTPFTPITKQEPILQICPECTALIYNLRDAIHANAKDSITALKQELSKRQKKGGLNPDFDKWVTTWFEKVNKNGH